MPNSQNELYTVLWKAVGTLRDFINPSESKKYVLAIFFLRFISERWKLIKEETDFSEDLFHDVDDKPFQGDYVIIPEGMDYFSLYDRRCESDFLEIIDNTLSTIEEANTEKLENVFHNISFNSLARISSRKNNNEAIKSLFECFADPRLSIDSANIDNTKIYSQAFDVLLSRFATDSGKSGGENYTPESIVRLMVNLLEPENGKSIYDPAVGTAGMLVQANGWVRNQYGREAKLNCFGQDINSETVSNARMNLYLHNITDAKIYHGDTLLDPKTVIGDELQRFDYVITNPPFSRNIGTNTIRNLKNDPYSRFRFGLPRNRSEFLFVQHVIASLQDEGRAIILVPPRALFVSGKDGEIRKQLIEEDIIEAVISLGPSLLAFTSLPINLLIINKKKNINRKMKILFINASEEYQRMGREGNIIDESHQSKIIQGFKNPEIDEKFSSLIEFEVIKENNFNLIPARYVDLVDVNNFLGGKVQWVKLVDIADIHTGIQLKKEERDGGSIPYIRVSDIQESKIKVDTLELVFSPSDRSGDYFTQNGDLLLSKVGFPPKVYLVDEDLEGVIVDKNLFVIRFKSEFFHIRQYVLEFLRSDKGIALLSSFFIGTTIPSLAYRDFQSIRIPIPEKSVVQLLSELHQTENDFLHQVEKTRDLRKQLFKIDDPDTVLDRLGELSDEAHILSASIVQAESLDYQIRNFYPFPLAFSYRISNAIHEPTQLYIEQLRVAENLLVFLACIGISLHELVQDEETKIERSGIISKFQDALQGGISPGDWWSIARFSAESLRDNKDYAVINSFSSLWFKGKSNKASDFAKKTKKLVELKNDHKHDRGPATPLEYEEAVINIQQIIDFCYEHLSFFVRYLVRLVIDIDYDFKSGVTILDTLVFAGDHQGLRREKCYYPSAPFTKNVIYIEVSNDNWISLYPFISAFYCPSCKTRETYFVDRFDGPDGKITLKSFERGHTHDGDEDAKKVSNDLYHWFVNEKSED